MKLSTIQAGWASSTGRHECDSRRHGRPAWKARGSKWKDPAAVTRKFDPTNTLERREGDSSAETRWVAQLYGLPFYRTRVLCRNGHGGPRLASTGECLACTAGRWTRWAARHPELAKAKRLAMMAAKGVLLSV